MAVKVLNKKKFIGLSSAMVLTLSLAAVPASANHDVTGERVYANTHNGVVMEQVVVEKNAENDVTVASSYDDDDPLGKPEEGDKEQSGSHWVAIPNNTKVLVDKNGYVVDGGIFHGMHIDDVIAMLTPPTEPERPTEPEVKPEPEQPIVPETKYFKDVPDSYWASKHINALHEQNIINGYPDNTYLPNAVISRMHVAMLMSRAVELEPIREGKDFKDVPKGHRAYEDVQKLYRAGVIDGKSEDLYGIDDNLTRAQMSKIIVKAFDLPTNDYDGVIYPDVGDDHWAKEYVQALSMAGVTTGSGGYYLPSDSVTRAHYAAFLHRALEQE